MSKLLEENTGDDRDILLQIDRGIDKLLSIFALVKKQVSDYD
jgi:hypothetical protein